MATSDIAAQNTRAVQVKMRLRPRLIGLNNRRTSKSATRTAGVRQRCGHSLHQREVSPEIRDAFGDAKEHGEVRRVGYDDVAGALGIRWEPEQAVELGVAGLRERVRSFHVDR